MEIDLRELVGEVVLVVALAVFGLDVFNVGVGDHAAYAVRVGGRKAAEGVDTGLAGGNPPKLDGAHRRVLLGLRVNCGAMINVHKVEPEDGAVAVGVAPVRDADVDREGLAGEGRHTGEPHFRDAVVGLLRRRGQSRVGGRLIRDDAVDDGCHAGAVAELDNGHVGRRDAGTRRNGGAVAGVERCGRDSRGVGVAAGGIARDGRRRKGAGAGGEVAKRNRRAVRADEGDGAEPVFAGVGDVVGDDDRRACRSAEDRTVGGEAGRSGQGHFGNRRAEEDVEPEVVELEAALAHDRAAENGDALDRAAGEGAGGVGGENGAAVGEVRQGDARRVYVVHKDVHVGNAFGENHAPLGHVDEAAGDVDDDLTSGRDVEDPVALRTAPLRGRDLEDVAAGVGAGEDDAVVHRVGDDAVSFHLRHALRKLADGCEQVGRRASRSVGGDVAMAVDRHGLDMAERVSRPGTVRPVIGTAVHDVAVDGLGTDAEVAAHDETVVAFARDRGLFADAGVKSDGVTVRKGGVAPDEECAFAVAAGDGEVAEDNGVETLAEVHEFAEGEDVGDDRLRNVRRCRRRRRRRRRRLDVGPCQRDVVARVDENLHRPAVLMLNRPSGLRRHDRSQRIEGIFGFGDLMKPRFEIGDFHRLPARQGVRNAIDGNDKRRLGLVGDARMIPDSPVVEGDPVDALAYADVGV